MKRKPGYTLITRFYCWGSWHWKEGKYCYSRSWREDRQFSCIDGGCLTTLSRDQHYEYSSR